MRLLRRKMNIGLRLTAAFLAIAFLTLTSGVIGIVGFWQATDAAKTLVENSEMIRTVLGIRASVGPLLGPASDFVLTTDPSASSSYAAILDQVLASIDTYEQAHQQHSHSAEHSRSAEALLAVARADVLELSTLGNALFASTDTSGAVTLVGEMEALLEAINERLDELLANAEEDIASARSVHTSAQSNAYIGLTASALLAFGLALGLALMITRSISQPLSELVDAADRISDGDLSTPVTIQGSDEIGQLSKAFERMRQTLIHERGQLRLLAVLEERDRIGREMHDGLAQVLGYVNTKAQAVDEFLSAGDTQATRQQLQQLITAAREAYTDAREAIDGLLMTDVGERALAELVQDYVARFERRSGVDAELHIAPSWDDDAVTATAKVQSLRIIQEALTNARKHANATHVDVLLDKNDGEAVIKVKDDGCGFMLSRLLRPDYSHYGLRTMRERTQAVGGLLRVESAPGRGTCIVATMPLQAMDGELR